MKWGVGVSFILLASTLILSGLKALGNHIFGIRVSISISADQ